MSCESWERKFLEHGADERWRQHAAACAACAAFEATLAALQPLPDAAPSASEVAVAWAQLEARPGPGRVALAWSGWAVAVLSLMLWAAAPQGPRSSAVERASGGERRPAVQAEASGDETGSLALAAWEVPFSAVDETNNDGEER